VSSFPRDTVAFVASQKATPSRLDNVDNVGGHKGLVGAFGSKVVALVLFDQVTKVFVAWMVVGGSSSSTQDIIGSNLTDLFGGTSCLGRFVRVLFFFSRD